MGLTRDNKMDDKTKADIEADMEQEDKAAATKQPKEKDAEEAPVKTCDCTGGPGRDNEPGTGLVDEYTVCPKCGGTGMLPE